MAEVKEYPAIEVMSAGVHGSGSSTTHHYKVEVRTSYSEPTVIGSGQDTFVIDHCWRTLPIRLGVTQWGCNIPIRSRDSEPAKHGMVSSIAAEAHRWAFLAFLDANTVTGSLCIEARLVEIELQQSYSTKELGVSDVIKSARRINGQSQPRQTPNA